MFIILSHNKCQMPYYSQSQARSGQEYIGHLVVSNWPSWIYIILITSQELIHGKKLQNVLFTYRY